MCVLFGTDNIDIQVFKYIDVLLKKVYRVYRINIGKRRIKHITNKNIQITFANKFIKYGTECSVKPSLN